MQHRNTIKLLFLSFYSRHLLFRILKKTILFVAFFTQGFAFAQSARKYSNEFLNIGVDARAFGMGNAVVANIGDVNAAYWNPAGLSDVIFGPQFSAMHAEYFQSIAKYDYLSVAFPIENNSTLAVSLYRFGVDDILNTTELIDNQGNIDYNKINKFSTADYALSASYAGNFLGNKDLQVGANAKIVYRHIGKFANSFGFGLDFGMRYKTESDFYFGLMARDITTTFNVWKINYDKLPSISIDEPNADDVVTVNDLPGEDIELTLPKLNLGVAKTFSISDRFKVLGEVDLNMHFQESNDIFSMKGFSLSPAAGVEISYIDMVFLRGGVNNFQKEMQFNEKYKNTFQPNVGVGFKYRGISIDYALTDIGDQSIALYSNIFSVKVDLSQWR
ncbi:Uncharacterised protein [Weeksella virosa]|uniref:PorV/PorQ family protein n=1 Tax=Weeksella virosa (strain ATCC 43766 / DSM 16922 / JCM 21250 / CCUG 30538 / CDC 9751 / IAM 14551 / NBRC 16016 / NCTC 11634 / CL345/78) TaxID=865938 RepID=F0NXC8_WEEVC|nr:hypothetical protein Weevi_0178 [Weeksella virosa DSM 16922]VEH63371.1 Uncharacterised protein [Weeksella virosa]